MLAKPTLALQVTAAPHAHATKGALASHVAVYGHCINTIIVSLAL